MNIEILSGIFTLVALIGTYKNTKLDSRGFYYWLASNLYFSLLNFSIGQYSLSLLFMIYFFLALSGLSNWKQKL